MNTKIIREKISQLTDETSGKTLHTEGAIRHIGIDAEKNLVILIIAINKTGGEAEKKLRREIAQIIKLDLGFNGVKIQFEEKRKIDSITNRKVRFIIISSGKGGVGKSTIAVNLAYALTKLNQKTAIIDADIYGSSVPRIMEMKPEYPKATSNKKIIPLNQYGIEIISTEFFTEPGKPVVWRGPMLHQMLESFFYQVEWNQNLDFMIIDAPPGTGDVTLDLRNIVPTAETMIVTTPHLAASHVAIKAGIAARQLKQKVIGVIENMSYFLNPVNGEKEYLFGQGGGEVVAAQLDCELLAQIPLQQPKKHLSLYEPEEENGQKFLELATYIMLYQN
ncbi:MAG: Mrp/NBP35 family ATP-binding protein [Bacilli bacterium]|nr:Mrp/NBP35 family ATP-binding protein [Bacilli bacterium]MDD4076787.1 P-loop NTPase [Bacilli bacterium]MDD4389162.1 P-loop NTPase [Bacilli bacterium]